MRTNIKLFCTAMILAGTVFTWAQEKNITGQVTDTNGFPVSDAYVHVEGEEGGVYTDADGNYTLSVNPGNTIVVEFIGFENKVITIGEESNYNISLSKGGVIELQETIVTALGFEKKKDHDLSSTTVVDTGQMQKSAESGVIQSLSGKTSGVNVTRSTGDPGAGAYIQIRGQNTILGNSSPLVIIDGVPVSNSSVGGDVTGVVQQSRLNDINPEDIESVSVLKGASAAAVWGTGAANGVIVITTKRGSKGGKKWNVSLKSSIAIDQINKEFEKQGLFGQGSGGVYNPNTGLSFGDLIANRSGGADEVDVNSDVYFISNTGNTYYPIITKNNQTVYNQSNRDAVFKDGVTFDNAVSVGYNGDKSKSFISFSNWNQDGIFRGNSDYERSTVKFNNDTEFTDKLSFKFSSSYTGINSNRVQMGSNLNGLYLGYLRNSPDFDIRDYVGENYTNGYLTPNSHRSYRRYLGSSRSFNMSTETFNYSGPAYDNPLWVLNQHINENDVSRFIVTPELRYKITPALSLYGRYGIDYYQDNRQTFLPPGSASVGANGFYSEDRISETNQTYNVFLRGSKDFNQWTMGGTAGIMLQEYKYRRLSAEETKFSNPDEIFLGTGNAVSENSNPETYGEQTRQAGAYAVLNFEFWNQILVELTGRGEYLSTTPNSGLVFYPSASVGWVFTDYVASDVFSFGKVRASYGEVGVGPQPYATSTYFTNLDIESGWGDGYDVGLYGNPSTRADLLGNPDLTVERKKEFEIGIDTRFFRNRVSFSATYYNNTNSDVVLDLPLPFSSGYANQFQNAAEINNKGVELDLGVRVVNTQRFNWDFNMNFTKNKNIVTDLAGIDYYFLNGFTGTSSGVAEGQPFGVLRGGVFNRDANGDYVLDANGFPIAADSYDYIGDPNPDWRGGLGTSVKYGGFSLSAFFETSQGNDIWNGTGGVLNYFGISAETAVLTTASQDLYNYNGDLITAGTEFRGYERDFGNGLVAVDQSWWQTNGGGFGEVSEPFVEDGSWTKLREISLYYSMPIQWFDTTAIRGIELGITGRNLVTWTDVEGYDPETNLTGASKGRGLAYFNNPGTRSFVTTLRINF
ncbi:SusC/RagA family TonB-linked outer membrane protein [Flavobacteriaceae bacterium Ap0902]|nr:SusC/RagA family TonB-linked outer membrane protein [Flavobacteriaceae bacterium Ap0902]